MLSHEELEDSLSGKAHKSLQYGINWQSSMGNLPLLRHSQRGQRLLFVPCPRTNDGRGQLPTWDAISGLKLQIIQLWKISIWCFSSDFRIVGHAVRRISLALKEAQGTMSVSWPATVTLGKIFNLFTFVCVSMKWLQMIATSEAEGKDHLKTGT